jgi:hypothetical protein
MASLSEEYPVHIRPLPEGGLELALLCPPSFRLSPDVRSEFDNLPGGLVQKVAEALAASFSLPSVTRHP